MKELFFVAGASGSGKSAIQRKLHDVLGSEYSVYDFDDIGVPKDADKKWRQEATEQWIKKLLEEKKKSVLLGQIVLGEVLASPSAAKLGKVYFCLLDVSDQERIKRLKARNTYGINQHSLNWAAWLRMHQGEPQWEQHVIKNDSWPNMQFARWDKLTNWKPLAFTHLIDTTNLTIEQVATQVKDWIETI